MMTAMLVSVSSAQRSSSDSVSSIARIIFFCMDVSGAVVRCRLF